MHFLAKKKQANVKERGEMIRSKISKPKGREDLKECQFS